MTLEFEHQSDPLAGARLPRPPRKVPLDYRQIRQQVSIQEVLTLIGWTPSARRGAQLRGPCPLHKSTQPRSRVFSVNIERHIFRCFKCGAKGNQLDLWSEITGLPLYAAAVDLCDRLGIAPPHLDQPHPP
jgi:DNA primase